MEIPLLDLKAQYGSIRKEIEEAIRRVAESQHFILSEEVSALEKEIASYVGTTYAAGVASGTDALLLGLKAAGVRPGDRVITSPFTFFASSEVISLAGAIPVFVDIDPETYNIDPGKIDAFLREEGPGAKDRIKAIIPVHLYGQCADMDRIMSTASRYGLKVIEDCAQAIGAVYKGKKAGSLGTCGCLSFFPSKNLGAFGDGGMIVSNDKAVIDHVKKLRVHGSVEQYVHDEIGYNSRLDSLQAAILSVKLGKLDGWLERRREIAARYDSEFSRLGIKIPRTAPGNTHTYHQYTIAVEDRDDLLQWLNDRGVASRVYYPVPLHLQPCYKTLGYSIGSFPVAERLSEKVLSLPVYPELSDEQISFIMDTVKLFYSERG